MSGNPFSDKQIQFIMDQRVQGYTFQEIADQFNEKYNESRSMNSIKGAFHGNVHLYDLPEIQKHPEKQREETKQKIVDTYIEFVSYNQYLPTFRDLQEMGCPDRTVRNHFGTLEELDEAAREKSPSCFKKVIDEYSFTEREFNELKQDVKKYKRFVITTAVTGCNVHQASLDAVKNFCKRNKAKLLILPCSDPASRRGRSKWELDGNLDKKSIVFKDLKLNNKFFLSTIKLSAKHINPLTGLSRIGQRSGSFCYASPKQSLEYVANSAAKKQPRALMTTGAITKPQYNTAMYMSERTAYIAEHDHVLGAVIVEIVDDRFFYFRQIQMELKTGAFYDLDTKYLANGKIKKYNGKDHRADLVQLGDYHVGDTDPLAKEVGRQLCDLVKPKYLTVEDFLNGHSINHHEEGKLITQSKSVEKAFHVLDTELQANATELEELMGWNVGQVVVKYGNHEDFLFRYLNNGNFFRDKVNFKRAINLSNAVLNYGWENPFEYAMREEFGIGEDDRVKFLQDCDDSFVLNGIENGAHGDKGPNGSRAPGLAGLEKCYGACNVGHTHSAGILRGVFRVGTSSYLKVSYNKGPSSWTQTHLIQHANGSRQLINCIEGKYKL